MRRVPCRFRSAQVRAYDDRAVLKHRNSLQESLCPVVISYALTYAALKKLHTHSIYVFNIYIYIYIFNIISDHITGGASPGDHLPAPLGKARPSVLRLGLRRLYIYIYREREMYIHKCIYIYIYIYTYIYIYIYTYYIYIYIYIEREIFAASIWVALPA